MGFRIQNNITALNAHTNLSTSDTKLSKSLQRLSSGFRINAAKDDAAGLAISQAFRANIASIRVAQQNVTEGNAMLQVAEGAMSTIGDILTRMKELATQAASANAGEDGRSKINSEYNVLVEEIDRIVSATQYSGTKLIDGSFNASMFQIGYDSSEYSRLTVSNLGPVDTATLTVKADDLVDQDKSIAALAIIDEAICIMGNNRASIGALQNRMDYAAANLATALENFTSAESVIRDVDMAAEMTNFTKNQILVQAGVAMLAQANAAPQQVLSLLQ